VACSRDGARSGQARRVVTLDLYTLIVRDGPTTHGHFAARRRPRPLLDSASSLRRDPDTLRYDCGSGRRRPAAWR